MFRYQGTFFLGPVVFEDNLTHTKGIGLFRYQVTFFLGPVVFEDNLTHAKGIHSFVWRPDPRHKSKRLVNQRHELAIGVQ